MEKFRKSFFFLLALNSIASWGQIQNNNLLYHIKKTCNDTWYTFPTDSFHGCKIRFYNGRACEVIFYNKETDPIFKTEHIFSKKYMQYSQLNEKGKKVYSAVQVIGKYKLEVLGFHSRSLGLFGFNYFYRRSGSLKVVTYFQANDYGEETATYYKNGRMASYHRQNKIDKTSTRIYYRKDGTVSEEQNFKPLLAISKKFSKKRLIEVDTTAKTEDGFKSTILEFDKNGEIRKRRVEMN